MRPGRPKMVAAIFLSFLGLTAGIQNCAVWQEITPCTCKIDLGITKIDCSRMGSFAEIVAILKNRFSTKDRISLKITYSSLYDLSERNFSELDLNFEGLYLNHDNLSELHAISFLGLSNVNLLSLADNSIRIMPKHIFANMPNVKTLDIGRIKLTSLPEDSFKSMPQLENLLLAGNVLSHVDSKSIPSTVRQLHIARDGIKDLNGTLRELSELRWLFINGNELTTLEGQLPKHGDQLQMLHASNNRIERLPDHFKTLINLESLFFQNNLVTRLDGALSKSRKLVRAVFDHNRLNMLAEDDFTEAENLKSLLLGFNELTALNGSILPLRRLIVLNLTHNWFREFSLEEIRGLKDLKAIDLSHNRINKIIGMAPNSVDWETRLTHLELNDNEITSLNGSLSGLRSLLRLNLSHNKLTRILPDDLIGLDQLRMLDISHNELTTLEETSKTFLPALEELIAHHNQLTMLYRDFHGLPVLCWADLSSNQIIALGRDLVSKTICKLPGMHKDNLGTLRLYLQDNPILCDAALPEIIAAFEINNTKIAGVSHCGLLSEQPTTAKPNAYFGYIPETQLRELQYNKSTYNPPTYPQIPPQQSSYVQQYDNTQEANNQRTYYNNEAQQNTNLDNKILTQTPLPYQNQNNLLYPKLTIPLTPSAASIASDQQTKSLRSTTNTERDQEEVREENGSKNSQQQQTPQLTVQEQQLSQLANKIEELKTRVDELTSQNQRLAENLNQMLPKAQTLDINNNNRDNKTMITTHSETNSSDISNRGV